MDKTELIERFGSFSLNKIETRGLVLHNGKYIFRMDDMEDCIDARSLYISREEYQTAKIINYMMAVTEVEKQASVYQY